MAGSLVSSRVRYPESLFWDAAVEKVHKPEENFNMTTTLTGGLFKQRQEKKLTLIPSLHTHLL
jgi:hypothetical protein